MSAIKLRTLEGGTTTVDGVALDAIGAALRGKVLVEGAPGYDEARTIWNAMIDRKPGIIIRCQGAADVVQAIRFAATHQLLVAVRGGGHNIAGNAVCDGGLMVDLSQMKSVRVDPTSKRAWVEPGATLADLDRETQAFGLALPTGYQLDYRHGWTDPRGRLRLDHTQIWSHDRQPYLCRRGNGGR